MPNQFPFDQRFERQIQNLDLKKKIRQVVIGLVCFLILAIILTCYYTVPADSMGVVTRFGVLRPMAKPGLHFKLPLGIDSVTIVQTERQMKQEFGYATPGATYEYQYSSQPQQRLEKNMVTGDLNSVEVQWVVQFRITDPQSFLFSVRNADETLRDASESVLREIVGDRSVDEIITVGRQEVEIKSREKLQELANLFQLGVTIDQIQLSNVDPPAAVQASFSEVNQAQQEREQAVNEAKGEYNKAVPRARGEADQRIREAEGYALKRVNEAEGDANRFSAIYKEYGKSPDVTRRRMYLETMQKVLPNLSRPYIVDPQVPGLLTTLPLGAAAATVAPQAQTVPNNAVRR
jgi:modulator of FtsH protease HflK